MAASKTVQHSATTSRLADASAQHNATAFSRLTVASAQHNYPPSGSCISPAQLSAIWRLHQQGTAQQSAIWQLKQRS
jgi:hypothetical protein